MPPDPAPTPTLLPAPTHGGNLTEAIHRFGHPRHAWLDLSTGINPHPYPVPALQPDAWHRLPEADAELALTRARYQVLATALARETALAQVRLALGEEPR